MSKSFAQRYGKNLRLSDNGTYIQNLDFMNVEQISIPNMSEAVQKDQYIKEQN